MPTPNRLREVSFLLVLAFASLPLTGCGDGTKSTTKTGGAADAAAPAAQAPAVTAELLASGEQLFTKQCASCHGEKGAGDGPAAYLLYPKPRDFGAAQFRLVSTNNQVPTDADLFHTITKGVPRSAMPAWQHLSEENRWALVHQVRRLARSGYFDMLVADAQATGDELSDEDALEIAVRKTTPGATWELPDETPVTLEALARGRQVYLRDCARCHGADGRGTGREDLVDNKGVPIRPRNFTRGIFKGGKASSDLATRVLSGIPGTPMPSFAKIFGMEGGEAPKSDDLWALVHYVQSLVRPDAQELAEQGQRTLVAKKLDALPEHPCDPAWIAVEPTYLALMHLWWSDDRPAGALVRVAHDGRRLGVHVTWEDRTDDGHVLTQTAFADTVAVQLSPSQDPPLFTMGSPDSPVNIWQWKAHWQSDLTKYADVETTHPNMAVDTYASLIDRPLGRHSEVADFATAQHDPTFLTGWGAGNLMSTPGRTSAVETLVATGFGSLTSRPPAEQSATGAGEWTESFWQVVVFRDLEGGGDGAIDFAVGEPVSIAFAVWDGSAGDRNGQKSVTPWHRVILE